MSTLQGELPDRDALTEFITTARWFGGKGRHARLIGVRRAATLGSLDGETGGPLLAIDLVTVGYADGERAEETYQVPLACYTDAQERLEHAAVGIWDDATLGKVHVYDAVHDHLSGGLLLRAFDAEATVGELRFRRLPGHDLDLDAHSTLLSAEQSNSSLAFGEDALLKLFRKVGAGHNPDIEIHRALTQAGSDNVAALYGWLELASDEPVHLAMLQQFLRTASDGWELALTSVRDLFAEADLRADEVGGDFAAESERLGQATLAVHDALSEAFPTETWGDDRLAELAAAMDRRLTAALGVVPELADHAGALRAAYAAVADLTEPVQAQRVHGDLHLGQTLRTVKGWKLVDFEGEPAKPLSERIRPDSRWRDVAGMLRSFDYAAHAMQPDAASDENAQRQIDYRAEEWSARNREAFLRGYLGEGTPTAAEQVLLTAYVADKAVYETVYEARNRPSWLPIPLAAIKRITSG